MYEKICKICKISENHYNWLLHKAYCVLLKAYCVLPISKLTHFQISKLPSSFILHPSSSIPIPSRIDKILNIIAHTQHKTVSCILLNIWKSEIIGRAKGKTIQFCFDDRRNAEILVAVLVFCGSETGSGGEWISITQNRSHQIKISHSGRIGTAIHQYRRRNEKLFIQIKITRFTFN